MGRKPARQGSGTAGEPLRRIALGILADARSAIDDRERSDAMTVHEFRKSMKRWRALLRLLEPFLGSSGKRLRLQARDLARELTGPRDAQAALNALDDTLKHDASFSKVTLQTVRSRIEQIRKEAENSVLNDDTRAKMRAYVQRASRSVARWPLERIGFADLAERLTETYRRARRRLPDDWRKAGADELHELRRRVIEHRYQMELVEPLWPRLGKLWVEETQRLRDRLGRYQDLEVLTALTAPRQSLARWRSKLVPSIAARQSVHVAAAARLGGRLFAERPKAFRRRLRAMWEASPHPGAG